MNAQGSAVQFNQIDLGASLKSHEAWGFDATRGKRTMSRGPRARFPTHFITAVLLTIGGSIGGLPQAIALDAVNAPTTSSVAPPALTATGQSRTLLPDGRWLLAGGADATGVLGRLSIRDGVTSEDLPVTLSVPRSGHTATVLPNGTVFIFGGTGADGQTVVTPEIIDPVSATVTPLANAALTPRTNHSATLLTSGDVLLVGGRDATGAALPTAELWNAQTGIVESTAAGLQVARYAHEAALLATGEGLVWGGRDALGHALGTGETFNPSTQTFEGPVLANDNRLLSAAAALTQPPTVAASNPAADALDVPLDAVLALRFNKALPMSALTIRTLTLVGPSGTVSGTAIGAEGGMLAFFTPTQPLLPATTYTLFVNGAADASGQSLPLTAVRFTTHRISVPVIRMTVAAAATSSSSTATSVTVATTTSPTPATAKTTVARTPPRPITTRPLLRKADLAPDTPVNEDWVPQEANRHGAWRILGLPRDPPVTTSTAPATVLGTSAPSVSGVVLRFSRQPLAGVAVSIGAVMSHTDASGHFLLTGLTAGVQDLHVDGTAVWSGGRHYTEHYLSVTVSASQPTALVAPIYLPRVDPATEVAISSPADREIVLTHPAIPGLEVHIPQGAVLRERNGAIVSKVSITPIPTDRAPYPVPAPFTTYFTLQPGGAYVDGDSSKAIKIIYPNYAGARAGSSVQFWNYDPSAGGWQVYGHGAVSADGKQVVADESVGFRQIMTFGFGISTSSGAPNAGPLPNGYCAADPVDCATGLFSHIATDLSVNDVMPIGVTRVYRTNDNQSHAFGVGAELSYDMWLYINPAWTTNQVYLIRADGSQIVCTGQGSPQTPPWRCSNSPTEFNGAVIAIDETNVTWDLTMRDGTVLRFDGVALVPQLASIIDRNGNVVTISHLTTEEQTMTATPITQVTSPNGRYIQFFYDSYNRISGAMDNAGRTTSYTYDSAGRLATATDADGYTEMYGYDPVTNNMNLVTDKRGNQATKNMYDSNGRVQTQTLADGALWQFSYTGPATGIVQQTTVTDPRNYVRQLTFNPSGYPVQVIDAQGKPEQQTTTFTRTPSNLPELVTDALGRETLYGYDSVGDLTSVTALYGTASAVSYYLQYDSTYHQLTSVTDPLNHTITVDVGARGNAAGVTDALGHRWSIAYNPQGLPVGVTDPLGHTTQFGFAVGADLSSITDALGRSTLFDEDAAGRNQAVTDPLGNRTQYGYDGMNRLTSVTNAIGGLTSLTYDQNGNLLTTTDPNHVTQTYTFDVRDRRHTYLDPAGKTATYNYDGLSNLTSFIDRKGQTTSIQYDGINRPTLVTYQDSSTINITWDAGNRPTRFADSLNGTITRQYDGLDHLTQESGPQGTVSYTYDAAERRQTMTVTGQPVINYTFDNANRLTQVAQGTTALGLGYDAANRRNAITWPDGIVGTFTFDNANELTGISYVQGSTSVGALAYTYDSDGRRTSVSGSLAGFVPPTSVPNFVNGSANRLTTWNGTSLGYDANGSLTTFGTTSYTWNVRNQLVATSAGTASYSYDALGRRVSATINGTTTPYLYDGLNAATIGGNVVLAGTNLDELFAQITSGTTNNYLKDGVNSTVAVANGAGAITGTFYYSPYGDTSSSGTTGTPLQYTGRENDAGAGLYYYRARYYSPLLGRFVSEDPIQLGGGSNFYVYANGNPISLRDPLGLWSVGDPLPDNVYNYSVGVADGLSWGFGRGIRSLTRYASSVSTCGVAYKSGLLTGVGANAIVGGIGLAPQAKSFARALYVTGQLAAGGGDLAGATATGSEVLDALYQAGQVQSEADIEALQALIQRLSTLRSTTPAVW